MRYLVRPLRQEFYAGTETLILATMPERADCVQEWPKKLDSIESSTYERQDYVAIDTSDPDLVIGYGSIWPQGEGRFRMDLAVAEDWRRQGVGTALFETLYGALRTQKATIVQARAFDYRPESLAFLMRRGFMETNRMIQQRLTLGNVVTDTQKLTADLRARGVEVVTLDQEQAHTTGWLAKVLELLQATGPGSVASPYQAGSETALWSLEDAERIWDRSARLSANSVFIAKRLEGCQEYVGLSFFSEVDTPSRALNQGTTAVHVDWRRQGIATLLKLHTIAYAQQNRYEAITTRTASPGMVALNRHLGFQPERAEVRLVKRIES